MVTPRKIYTAEQKKILLSNPLRLRIAYTRDNERAIVIEVRYDPNINEICLSDPTFLNESDGNFFLLKAHFRQFTFSAKCFRWEHQMAYPDFLDLFTNIISDLPKNEPLIVRVAIKRSGDVNATVESAEPVDTMFDGLVDQVAMNEFRRQLQQENKSPENPLDPSNQPDSPEPFVISDVVSGFSDSAHSYDIVCVDTQATLPCYATTFATSDNRLIDLATERARSRCFITSKPSHSPTELYSNRVEDERSDGGRESVEGHPSSPQESIEQSPMITSDVKVSQEALEGREILPLMYNPAHEVMSCGQWVLVFHRNGGWYTPKFCSGGRSDPLRMMLLRTGILKEGIMFVQGVKSDEVVLLLSASRGIRHARLVGKPPTLLDRYTRRRKRKRAAAFDNNSFMKEIKASIFAEKTSNSVNIARAKDRNIPFTSVIDFKKK